MNVIQQQNQLIQEADACLNRIQVDLKSVADGQISLPSGGESDMENLRTLQLVLQFRLDTQDALQRLFRFSQSVWQILGVSSQNSSTINLERLAFALGSDDLHHALSMLNRLIDSLLRILQRYYLGQYAGQRAPTSRKAPMMRPPDSPRLYQKMVRVVDNQKSFIFILNQLTNSLEATAAEPIVGPVYDHICKLEGPVSHFFQALQNGLVLSAGIYQQLEATCQLNKKLDELLQKANTVLEQSHQLTNQPRLYQPTKEISSSQELETRASEKRLGLFFRPY